MLYRYYISYNILLLYTQLDITYSWKCCFQTNKNSSLCKRLNNATLAYIIEKWLRTQS